MMSQRWMATIVAVGLAVLVACGGGDDADAGSSDTGSNGANGTAGSSSGGASTDLDGFAVPLPGWAEAVTPDIGSGGLDVVLFRVPIDERDATVTFYEEWSGKQSESFLRTDSAAGGVTLQSDVAAGEEKTIISILSPRDGDDFVSVSVSRGVFE